MYTFIVVMIPLSENDNMVGVGKRYVHTPLRKLFFYEDVGFI